MNSFFVCLFYPGSISYLVSGSWLQKHCWLKIHSCRVSLKSNQKFIAYFHKVIVSIALEHFVGTRDCKSTFFLFCWFLGFSFSVLCIRSFFILQRLYNVLVKASCCHPPNISKFSECVIFLFSYGALSVYREHPLFLCHSLVLIWTDTWYFSGCCLVKGNVCFAGVDSWGVYDAWKECKYNTTGSLRCSGIGLSYNSLWVLLGFPNDNLALVCLAFFTDLPLLWHHKEEGIRELLMVFWLLLSASVGSWLLIEPPVSFLQDWASATVLQVD